MLVLTISSDGRLRINAFEKLPEKREFPEYFQEIRNPIALDIIRVGWLLINAT